MRVWSKKKRKGWGKGGKPKRFLRVTRTYF